jgi:hypothetical protein
MLKQSKSWETIETKSTEKESTEKDYQKNHRHISVLILSKIPIFKHTRRYQQSLSV